MLHEIEASTKKHRDAQSCGSDDTASWHPVLWRSEIMTRAISHEVGCHQPGLRSIAHREHGITGDQKRAYHEDPGYSPFSGKAGWEATPWPLQVVRSVLGIDTPFEARKRQKRLCARHERLEQHRASHRRLRKAMRWPQTAQRFAHPASCQNREEGSVEESKPIVNGA